MSFINWGNETPEQKQLRRKIEEDHFQNAMIRKVFEARSSANSVGVTGVGTGNNNAPAYGYAIDGSIYAVNSLRQFNISFTSGENAQFPTEAILCEAPGNYFYYLFYYNDGLEYNGFYFGKINSLTGKITTNNAGNLAEVASNKTPSSLYLEPNGNLIMLDSKFAGIPKNIIRIDTDYNGTGEWHASEVSIVDPATQEFGALLCLFTVDGEVYGVSAGVDPNYERMVGKYDITLPEHITGTNNAIQLYKNDLLITNNFEVTSVVQGKDSIVYANCFYLDPDTEGYEFGIFNLDVTTGIANWIKFSYVEDTAPLVILFTK